MPTQNELQKLKQAFESVYLIKDKYIIKVLMALYISHLLKSDPIWIVIVAPSGGNKSEFVNSLSTCKYVYPLSTLTSHSFISGIKKGGGQTASLLLNLSKGTDQEQSGIITFKDMTSILSEHKDERALLMAQLREIYDGKYSKQFGTGEIINWAGKVTIIAGATFAIHSMRQSYIALGERFLFYELIQPERIEAASRSMENQESGEIQEKRLWLSGLTQKYLNETTEMPEALPKISKELKDELLVLSELTTRARSEVERNWFSPQQEILEVHPPEMPTRFAAALQTMARALIVINWNETDKLELLEEDRKILDKLSLDSITKSKRTVIRELAKYDIIQTAGLAIKLGMPTNTIRRRLEDLVALEIADREKGSGAQGDKWQLKDKYRQIIRKFEEISKEGDYLTEETAEESGIARAGESALPELFSDDDETAKMPIAASP